MFDAEQRIATLRSSHSVMGEALCALETVITKAADLGGSMDSPARTSAMQPKSLAGELKFRVIVERFGRESEGVRLGHDGVAELLHPVGKIAIDQGAQRAISSGALVVIVQSPV